MQIHLSVVYLDEVVAALRQAFGRADEATAHRHSLDTFYRLGVNGFVDRAIVAPFTREDQKSFVIIQTAWVQKVQKVQGQHAPRAKTRFFLGTHSQQKPFYFYCLDWVTDNQRCKDASLFEALFTCPITRLQIAVHNCPRHKTIQELFEREGPGIFRSFSDTENYDEGTVSGDVVVGRMKQRIIAAQRLAHDAYNACKDHMAPSIAEQLAKKAFMHSRSAYAFQWWNDGHGGPFEPVIGWGREQ